MTNPNNKDDDFSKIARAWQKILLEKGCEHTVRPGLKYGKVKRFSRSWRRLFKYLNINPHNRPDLSIFEVGCGGIQRSSDIDKFYNQDSRVDKECSMVGDYGSRGNE